MENEFQNTSFFSICIWDYNAKISQKSSTSHKTPTTQYFFLQTWGGFLHVCLFWAAILQTGWRDVGQSSFPLLCWACLRHIGPHLESSFWSQAHLGLCKNPLKSSFLPWHHTMQNLERMVQAARKKQILEYRLILYND